MSDFAHTLQHEHHERRKSKLGAVLLLAVIAFIVVALFHYL